MVTRSILLLISCWTGHGWAKELLATEKLSLFITSNYNTPVSIQCESADFSFCRQLFLHLATRSLVPSVAISVNTLHTCTVQDENDFHVLVLSAPLAGELRTLLHLVASKKVETTLIYFSIEFTTEDWTTLYEEVRESKQNLHCFFAVKQVNEKLSFFVMISLKDQTDFALHEVHFLEESFVMKKDFNLQGMEIASISRTWMPYITFDECKDDIILKEVACHANSYGMLVDIGQMIARRFNFTLLSLKRRDGKWGAAPTEGPYNFSGTWDGIMGDIMFGTYPLSINGWNPSPERQDLLDFVTFMGESHVLALTPKHANFDMGMLLRPFTKETWFYLCGIFGAAVVLETTALAGISFFPETDGGKILYLTVWYFFVVIYAYYGGAMTMFFSTEDPIPFNSLQDAIRAYPEWNLISRVGNEIFFILLAETGDQDVEAYVHRLNSNPAEVTFNSTFEGLKRATTERTIMHMDEAALRGYFLENPFLQQQLKFFGREGPFLRSMIFTDNSPIAPVFDLGIQQLRQSGILFAISQKWIGRDLASAANLMGTMILDTGQVALLFLFLLGATGLSSVIFFIEYACAGGKRNLASYMKQEVKLLSRWRTWTKRYRK